MKNKDPFIPDKFYHVYNRTNNRELLFRESRNFQFFLKRLQYYMNGVVEFYSYALIKNHFHFLISIKSNSELLRFCKSTHPESRTQKMRDFLSYPNKSEIIHNLISSQFRRFFISYSQAYNKLYKREGNLLNRSLKRKIISNSKYFKIAQYYIHHNARKHGIVDNFMKYEWHSFHNLISDENTFLNKQYVLNIYGDIERFIAFHNEARLNKDLAQVRLEE